MQWLTDYVSFHDAGNSRQKEQHRKMSDVQMFFALHVRNALEFLNQRRSGTVLMGCRHEGQGLYKKKDTYGPLLTLLSRITVVISFLHTVE